MAYSSAGSSSELTEDYCEHYSDLFQPNEYRVRASSSSPVPTCMSFSFIQSLICMLHESLAQSRVTLQLYVLFCRKPTTRGFPQTGDIGGFNDPSLGSPLGKIPWDPRARSRGERNQQLSGETLNNSYFESSFVDLMETRIRQENLVWREKQKPQSAGKQEGGRCQRSKSQNPSCEKNFRRQRGEHWREERPHEEQCHNNYF